MSQRLVVAAVAALAAAGCDRPTFPTANLAGEVTIDGEPVAVGGLTFVPRQPRSGTGVYADIEQGRYRAVRVPIGSVRIFVMAATRTDRTVEINGESIPEAVSLVPPRYEAGIDIDVVGDDDHRDFDLRSARP